MTIEQIDKLEDFITFEYDASQEVISRTKKFLKHLNPEILHFILPEFAITNDGGIWGGTLNKEYIHCPDVFFTMKEKEFRAMGGGRESGGSYLIMEGSHEIEDFSLIYCRMVERTFDEYNEKILGSSK